MIFEICIQEFPVDPGGRREQGANRMKSDKGFTLVEVAVTLVVLGIVAAIAVPACLGFIDKGKARECETHRQSLLGYYSADVLIEESKEKSAAVVAGIAYDGLSQETMQDVLNQELSQHSDLTCPSGGSYTAQVDDAGIATITCDTHDVSTVNTK